MKGRKDAAVVATHKTLRQAHTQQRSTQTTYITLLDTHKST